MKVLITGATGFWGFRLVKKLGQHGKVSKLIYQELPKDGIET